jgi:tetratricopeptide (TPR) repeat protein
MNAVVAVATSIPPVLSRRNAGRAIDAAYQKLCARSWLASGFRVLSVNHVDEIPALAGLYPEVSFIATERDTSAISGRRTPYIADLLRALVDAPEPVVGIINSDLVFEPSVAWIEALPRMVGDAVVTGQRRDVTSLIEGTFRKYYWGFDFFFFDINAARDLLETAMPFAMGLAWWDYWLPAALSLAGRRVITLERPTVAHLIHKEPQLDDTWRELAIRFAAFIVQKAAKHPNALPPAVGAVLPLCHALSQMPEQRWRNRGADAEIGQMAMQFIPAITTNALSVPASQDPAAAALPHEISPATVFHRFDERLAAGEALERAKRLDRDGRVVEASGGFQYALDRTPLDVDVLSAFGEFRLRRGDASGAIDLLRNAVKNAPEDHAVYVVLAIALYQCKRQVEAITTLENALAKWPDFTEARELRKKFSNRPQYP